LEAGCGAGRFTEVLLALGAHVVSCDLSTAVWAHKRNFPQQAVFQADITQLPCQPEQFAMVFCLGVIQHTLDPEATIRSLWGHVRPGGLLVIDHYRYTLGWYLSTAPLVRLVLRRLPAELGMRITDALVRLFLPVHRWCGTRCWLYYLVSRLSPITSYYHSEPRLSDALQQEWALLDTPDNLTDWYKHRRTVKQIAVCLRQLPGVTQIEVWRGG
jgi:SAM-dependent methyltransferase